MYNKKKIDKIMAKIVWEILNYTAVISGFAFFITLGIMIMSAKISMTHLAIMAVSALLFGAYYLFVKYLNTN